MIVCWCLNSFKIPLRSCKIARSAITLDKEDGGNSENIKQSFGKPKIRFEKKNL